MIWAAGNNPPPNGPPLQRSGLELCPHPTPRRSDDRFPLARRAAGRGFRRFEFAAHLRGGRQLQYGRSLARNKPRHQHDLAAGELQRVMMNMRIVHVDLAKAGDALVDPGAAEHAEGAVVVHGLVESDLGAGKETYRYLRLADFAEAARERCDKIGGDKRVHDLGWSRRHEVKAVVAHDMGLLRSRSCRRLANGSSSGQTRRLVKCSWLGAGDPAFSASGLLHFSKKAGRSLKFYNSYWMKLHGCRLA